MRQLSRNSIGLDPRLNQYLVTCGDREHEVAAKIREASGRSKYAMLQISPEQGQFLAMLVKLIGARTALEVGTFYGYSALWVALALPADGKLIACDINRAWADIARRYWREAGVGDKVELRLAPAIETLQALVREGGGGRFDFAFIDADKKNYDAYYEAALVLVRSGGVIAFDNMLWRGAVADPEVSDPAVNVIRSLNAKIAGDERVDKVLLPLGDGMTVARRR